MDNGRLHRHLLEDLHNRNSGILDKYSTWK